MIKHFHPFLDLFSSSFCVYSSPLLSHAHISKLVDHAHTCFFHFRFFYASFLKFSFLLLFDSSFRSFSLVTMTYACLLASLLACLAACIHSFGWGSRIFFGRCCYFVCCFCFVLNDWLVSKALRYLPFEYTKLKMDVLLPKQPFAVEAMCKEALGLLTKWTKLKYVEQIYLDICSHTKKTKTTCMYAAALLL